jgi:hypothetical protein
LEETTMSSATETVCLYGPRATGIRLSGGIHHDEATVFDGRWYLDEDAALTDLEETAALCGHDPDQWFALVSIDLDLPSWWDELSSAVQEGVLADLAARLGEYPAGYSLLWEQPGSDFVEDQE